MYTTPQPYAPYALSSSKADSVSSGIDEGKESSTKALLTANISSKEAKLFEDSEKAVDTTK